MFHILIAPNSFKNSLKADKVANAIEKGLKGSGIQAQISKFPIADGGDYSSFLICKQLNGEMKSMEVAGAYLRKTKASFGLIDSGKCAVIEVAETSGFKSIKGKLKSPLQSSSKGLGQLISAQIESGVKDFIICLGGSVTVDCGIGMLQALGLVFRDKKGNEIQPLPHNFDKVESMDTSEFKERISGCKFTVLCDVENKLMGSKGAARVFGPQKGASEEDIDKLEEFLKSFDRLTRKTVQKSLNSMKAGGAAGGLGAAFSVFFDAELKEGASYFCELTGFDAALDQAQLLITGEGSIDSQSLEGKAPIVVAAKAKAKQIPCIALAGKVPLKISKELQEHFLMLLPIGNQPEELEESLEHTEKNLVRTALQLGRMLGQFK